jgi:steroid delta-isomerase-like uncharacterized protein
VSERNKAVVRDGVVEAIHNQKRFEVVDEIYAPEYVSHVTMPGGLAGDREGLKRALRIQVAAFPDVHYTIEDLIAEGDRVVLHNTWRATHTGEYLGFPPTGKRITVKAMHFLRLQDGRIVEHWGVQDRLGLVQQLGARD